MRTSNDRILTTHVGSLPRPEQLADMLRLRYRGEPSNTSTFETLLTECVETIVRQQVEAGIDIVSDGEMGKVSYTHYVKDRIDGLTTSESVGAPPAMRSLPPDFADHTDWLKGRAKDGEGPAQFAQPRCVGRLSYGDGAQHALEASIYAKAVAQASPTEAFLNSASPGILAGFIADEFYGSQSDFIEALAEVMRFEYESIYRSGFLLQIDSPDLAGTRHLWMSHLSDEEYVKLAGLHVEIINHATRNIPSEAIRMHVCWGNYAGPHTHDIPVTKLFGVLAKSRPQAISFEGANPRHEHEWEDWKDASLPEDKILIPGVIDSTSNFVEHPRLVAQRICRYASIFGRERIIAGSDCGFSTYVGTPQVYPSIVWAKFRALSQGAEIASHHLWSR